MNPGAWDALAAEVRPALEALRVGFYATAGAPYHHAALIALWGGVPEPLAAQDIRAGGLEEFDVLIVPGGGLNAMSGQLGPLGESGARAIREWVAGGGMYIGTCAGAYSPARVPERFLRANPAARELALADVRIANAADAGLGGLDSPGVGVLRAELAAPDHWLARGLRPQFEVVHYNGPCFLPPEHAAGVVRLVGPSDHFTAWEDSLNPQAAVSVLEALARAQSCLAVAAPLERGQVVLFGSHPEFGFDALQLGWGEPVRLLANALVFQASRRSAPAARPPTGEKPVSAQVLTDLAASLERAAARLARLAPLWSPWLTREYAPAFWGRDPDELWREALIRAAEVTRNTARGVRELSAEPDALARFGHWIDRAPAPDQDYGFEGLKQLCARLYRLIDAGERALNTPPQVPASPYDLWDRHPYHLLASSYLSAAGVAASLALAALTLSELAGVRITLPFSLTAPERTPPHVAH
ncbi:hypothetical protein HNR42_002019 [Deinobacterium chartae]|uniref:Biotin-protein ligase N-terminal domain-containing protein n=1 Tax=Deinobacterium chartae TaxID=521158 RepID=A0A841I3U5_9DEIO|nr:BPL-N domain-containing protein [Deinobacterium chartae]MBB6098585.1 hypothetical protein [Deinobacterium chartae]